MKRLLQWMILLAALVGITSLVFALFSHFLVDYSLEDLELTLAAVERDPEATTPVTQNVYQRVVHDMVLAEASRENMDVQSLVLLELASRSFGEAFGRGGYARAKFYLEQTALNKIPNRNPILRIFDAVYQPVQKMYESILSFVRYLQRRSMPAYSEIQESVDYSSLLLLIQAQQKEKSGDLEDAVFLYRKYLKLYPQRSDRGFVSVSLAQIFMKLKRYDEAERLLDQIFKDFAGAEEGEVASGLLRKIETLQEREVRISHLEALLDANLDPERADIYRFRLGLEYLSSYQYVKSQQIFKQLELARDPILARKAKFYVGLLYKFNSEYDQGIEVLLELLKDSSLEREWGVGLHAQLADIYYQKKDLQKSLSEYETISQIGETEALSQRAAFKVWMALAELEQTGIYYFDLKDPLRGERHMKRFSELFPHYSGLGALRKAIIESAEVNLRDLAFEMLKKRRVHEAYDLFQKFLQGHPRDAWGHGGLATVYILLADLNTAFHEAEQAYHLLADEYTQSVLGYVYGFLEKYPEAVDFYRKALVKDPEYIPALYNLSCAYFERAQYEEAFHILTKLERIFHDYRNIMRSKILNNLGCALWKLGKKDEARKRLQEALKVTPGFPDAVMNLDDIAANETPQAILKEVLPL